MLRLQRTQQLNTLTFLLELNSTRSGRSMCEGTNTAYLYSCIYKGDCVISMQAIINSMHDGTITLQLELAGTYYNENIFTRVIKHREWASSQD